MYQFVQKRDPLFGHRLIVIARDSDFAETRRSSYGTSRQRCWARETELIARRRRRAYVRHRMNLRCSPRDRSSCLPMQQDRLDGRRSEYEDRSGETLACLV